MPLVKNAEGDWKGYRLGQNPVNVACWFYQAKEDWPERILYPPGATIDYNTEQAKQLRNWKIKVEHSENAMGMILAGPIRHVE